MQGLKWILRVQNWTHFKAQINENLSLAFWYNRTNTPHFFFKIVTPLFCIPYQENKIISNQCQTLQSIK